MKTGLIIMSTACKTATIKAKSHLISDVIELQVVIDDVAIDSSKVDLKTLFASVDQTGKVPQTSQPTPHAIETAINKCFEDHDNVVIITPHSQISGTYQNCVAVASDHPRQDNISITEVNGGIAVTEAMLIDYTLNLLEQNLPFAEIKQSIEAFNKRLVVYTFPGDFKYLKVSGRVNGAAALLLNALNIRVVVKMEAGTPAIDHKGRGEKSILKYIDDILADDNIEQVCYAPIVDNLKLREEVIKLFDKHNINYEITEDINSVPAAHLGPNNFGLGILRNN